MGIVDDEGTDIFQFQGRMSDLLIKAVAFGVPGEYAYQVFHLQFAQKFHTSITLFTCMETVKENYVTNDAKV